MSTAALVYAFVTRDFGVRYVAENSNIAMPHVYTWVAFYAGNAGSLLYLALVLAAVSAIAVLTIRKRLPHTTPYALGTMALILLFFLAIMLFLANPLERAAHRAAGWTGHKPAAGAFRHVHTSALADGGACACRRAVQHRYGRACGETGRARRVGGPGQAVGHGVVAGAYDGTDARKLVGLHHTRLGRLLGMGPGGELRADALGLP